MDSPKISTRLLFDPSKGERRADRSSSTKTGSATVRVAETRRLILSPIHPTVMHANRPPAVHVQEVETVARILIVDDEEADRLLIQAILEHAGHETVFAADGEEALRQLALKSIDIVVTDLQMPEVHGFELITVLRDFEKPPGVIAVSGTGPFQLHMAEALGAKYTLTKPLDPQLLVDAVNRTLLDKENA